MNTEATNSSRRAITVSDVAKHAGVSRATVSYALTQPSRLSDDMLTKVRASIDALGYVGNDAARRLRRGQSQALGLVVANAGNPVYAQITQGAEAEAARRGMFILLANAGDSEQREREYLRFFESQQVNGVMIAPVDGVPAELSELRGRGTPFVVLGNPEGKLDFPTVGGDGRSGGRMAADHLIRQGRRRLLFVGGPHPEVEERLEGARQAVAAAPSPVSLEVIRVPLQTAHAGEDVAAELLSRAELPDGVFAGNDLLALGLMHRVIASGVRLPQELSIVGYDDIEFSDFAIVPLTTIRHSGYEMGVAAVSLLFAEHSDRRVGEFPPELVIRSTSLPIA